MDFFDKTLDEQISDLHFRLRTQEFLNSRSTPSNDSIPKDVLEEWLDDVLVTASNLPSNLYLKNEGMKDAVQIIINHMVDARRNA